MSVRARREKERIYFDRSSNRPLSGYFHRHGSIAIAMMQICARRFVSRANSHALSHRRSVHRSCIWFEIGGGGGRSWRKGRGAKRRLKRAARISRRQCDAKPPWKRPILCAPRAACTCAFLRGCMWFLHVGVMSRARACVRASARPLEGGEGEDKKKKVVARTQEIYPGSAPPLFLRRHRALYDFRSPPCNHRESVAAAANYVS